MSMETVTVSKAIQAVYENKTRVYCIGLTELTINSRCNYMGIFIIMVIEPSRGRSSDASQHGYDKGDRKMHYDEEVEKAICCLNKIIYL